MELAVVARALVVLALLLPSWASAQEPATSPDERLTAFRDEGVELGTSYHVIVLAPEGEADRVGRELAEVRQLIRPLEGRFSEWRADSDISRLNRQPAGEPLAVADDVARLLRGAVHVAEVTGGAFDPTWKGLEAVWERAESAGELPGEEDLRTALEGVGWSHLVLSDDGASRTNEATQIGVEGVAKGWIIDVLFNALVDRGYRHILVNIGGDLMTSGREADGSRRVLQITDPFDGQSVAGYIEVENVAVATSGNYLRHRQVGAHRVGHILDPRTGRPPAFDGSVTVLAPDAAMADALATALFVLGPEEGMSLAERLEQIGVIYVTRVGVVSNVEVADP